MQQPRNVRAAFSLVELVIVIVIIATIAAIAIPRVTNGASKSREYSVQMDLNILRGAIDRYSAEHGGTYPVLTPAGRFKAQMTQYTDFAGNVSPNKTTTHIYGPYLATIPKLSVGEGAGSGRGKDEVADAASDTVGWVYDETSGKITANSGTATDRKGELLTKY